MKEFDLAVAKKGARVCTKDERKARILCFDVKDDNYPICAAFIVGDREVVDKFSEDGRFNRQGHCELDLMMADDDYLEKLERGEYHSIKEYTPCLYDASNNVWQQPHIIMGPEAPVWQEPHYLSPIQSETVSFDEAYWRKMYAGMAMQGLCAANGTMKPASMVADVAVEYADALVEELKKEKE